MSTNRYHGFTCPKCGSHFFGTSVLRGPDGQKQTFGRCHENQYSANGCDFTWDRDDAEAEAKAMYEQTKEEWMRSWSPQIVGYDYASGGDANGDAA